MRLSSTLGQIMFAPVRIGVVGFGNFGRLHAQTTTALSETELVAIVDQRPQAIDAARECLPHVPAWTDIDEALAKSDAEAWVVASSTASHVAIAKKLLTGGACVLVEKPISEDLAEAESLAPLVSNNSANFMAGHIVLFNSEFRQLLDEVQRREPIAYIDAVRHRPTTTMQLFPGESPYHLTMVHDLYCVLALTNSAEPYTFSAQSRTTTDGACDLALAQFQWKNGVTASLTASFLTPSGMAGDGFDRLEVFGCGWSARIHPNPRPIEIWDERAHWPSALEIRTSTTSPSGMLAEELRCFCRVVRRIEPVPIGARYADALQVQRWLDKLDSMRSNSAQETLHC